MQIHIYAPLTQQLHRGNINKKAHAQFSEVGGTFTDGHFLWHQVRNIRYMENLHHALYRENNLLKPMHVKSTTLAVNNFHCLIHVTF